MAKRLGLFWINVGDAGLVQEATRPPGRGVLEEGADEMKRMLLATAILVPAFATCAASAGIGSVVDALKAQGYSAVEASQPHDGKIAVEAYRQGIKRELVYDAGTGRLLSDESHRTDAAGSATHVSDDDGATSTGHDTDDHGGTSAGQGGDDHGSDDHGTDDHGTDDHGGASSGSSSDDHGGTSSGHDSGDDGGNDDGGSDHGGSDY
jgi:hypothetical protein